jgi:hypothetical protein
LCKFFQER